MPEQLTRQEVARKLIRAPSPGSVLDILVAHQAARDDGILADIESISHDFRKYGLERVGSVCKTVKLLKSLALNMADISDLASLTQLMRSSYWYWSPKWPKLVEAIASDAAASGCFALSTALNRGISLMMDAYQRWEMLLGFRNYSEELQPSKLGDQVPLMLEPAFVDWLYEKGRAAFRFFDNDKEAIEIFRIVEKIEYEAYRYDFSARSPNKTDYVHMLGPPGTSELWFVVSPEVFEYFERLTKKMERQAIPIESVLLEVSQTFARIKTGPPIQGHREHRIALGQTSFLRFLVHTEKVDLIRSALESWRQLIEEVTIQRLPVAARMSAILRYAFVMTANYTVLSDSQAGLRDVLELVNQALTQVDMRANPSLYRDLMLTRGRVRRELNRFQPEDSSYAIPDLEVGLTVQWRKYDREVRGRALGDYASALAALRGDVRPDDTHIIDLYREAILWLDEFPGSQFVVLMNLAIFFNERKEGVNGRSQEEALKYIGQAIQVIEQANQEDDYFGPRFTEELAGLQLTKSNILRERAFADAVQCRSHSIDACRRGLTLLRDSSNMELIGLLRLSMGRTYAISLELQDYANLALQQFDTAIQHLENYPTRKAHALVSRAEVLYRSFPLMTHEIRALTEEVTQALAAFHQYGDTGGIACACRLLADLHRETNSATRSGHNAVIDYFRTAISHYIRNDDVQPAIECMYKCANLFVEMAILHPANGQHDISEAHGLIERAVTLLQERWEVSELMSWHLEIASQLSSLVSDQVWLEAKLGRPIERLLELSRRTKMLELVNHLRDSIVLDRAPESEHRRHFDDVRRLARMSEADLLRKGPLAPVENDILERLSFAEAELDAFRQALSDAEVAVIGPLSAAHRATVKLPEDAIYCDICVAEWGTVVFWNGRGLPAGGSLVHLQLTRSQVASWIFGSEKSTGWYKAYTERTVDHARWKRATLELIEAISSDFWKPCIDSLGVSLSGALFYVAPGALASLPIHAAHVDGTPIIQQVNGMAYVTHLQGMASRPIAPRPKSALCVASNPNLLGRDEVLETVHEVCDVGTLLASKGVKVQVAASSGDEFGDNLLRRIGRMVHSDNLEVIDARPTPEWVLDQLPHVDFFLFSGHGGAQTSMEPELILVDENGDASALRLFDILAGPLVSHGLGVVLSACESARDVLSQPGEMLSTASGFIRTGASFVVGTQWIVGDVTARRYSQQFCHELLEGAAPEEAYVLAVRSVASSDVVQWGTFCLWISNANL